MDAKVAASVDRTPAPPPPEATFTPREDEISVPPVTPAEFDDAFFASRPPPHARIPAELDVVARDLRMEQLTSPAAHARRAELAKYVKGVVAVSLAVCFLAFIRLAVQRNHAGETNAMAATEAPKPALTIAAPPPPPPPPATEAPKVTPPAEPAPVATQTAPVADAPKTPEPPSDAKQADKPGDKSVANAADAPPTNSPAATDTAAVAVQDPAAAKIEKRKSQSALERGATAEAIDHGELAVKLDPADGEAWLILGASYQAKGSWLDARRCYKSCLSEGKRGPRGECSAMLR